MPIVYGPPHPRSSAIVTACVRFAFARSGGHPLDKGSVSRYVSRPTPAMRMVAALYVDPLGPYQSIDGVECWDEARDARLYPGPHPIVAHPPCGPWGRLHRFCTRQDPSLGPLAVAQVRRWGGVLEHPKASRLWRHCSLPLPGELPDAFGGRSVDVAQVNWGHRAQKDTWLYIVAPVVGPIHLPQGATPTHVITTSRTKRASLPECGKVERRLTPLPFALFLVGVARRCDPCEEQHA